MAEIRKLLVANRGEIAIRVFRSAHELGVRTVAIYSHEDRFAMHRLQGRRGVPGRQGGRADPAQLSERSPRSSPWPWKKGSTRSIPATASSPRTPSSPAPARRPGSSFVGPRAPNCSTMLGDKVAARKIAFRPPACRSSAAVAEPVLPGPEARALAEGLGFPVIVKASMGGGGRGMRVVEFGRRPRFAALDQARREALAAFGCADVFLEKFIQRAKHIEVQLLGDHHGQPRPPVSNATARCSAGIRRSSRSPRRTTGSTLKLRDGGVRRRDQAIGRSVRLRQRGDRRVPGRRRRGLSSTSSRSIRASRSSTPSPRSSPAVDVVKSQILIAQGAPLSKTPRSPSSRPVRPSMINRASRSSAASRPKTPRTTSRPTTAASRIIGRPAAWACGSMAAWRSPAASSRRSTTRCW